MDHGRFMLPHCLSLEIHRQELIALCPHPATGDKIFPSAAAGYDN